jgi:hypothetical protein
VRQVEGKEVVDGLGQPHLNARAGPAFNDGDSIASVDGSHLQPEL